MIEDQSLHGWTPELGPNLTIGQVIDEAFHYRGNVTVVKKDGSKEIGYLANRDISSRKPFVHLFDEAGNGPIRILYADIQNINFTGKDTAAGQSWDAWVKRRDKQRQDTENIEAAEGNPKTSSK